MLNVSFFLFWFGSSKFAPCVRSHQESGDMDQALDGGSAGTPDTTDGERPSRERETMDRKTGGSAKKKKRNGFKSRRSKQMAR